MHSKLWNTLSHDNKQTFGHLTLPRLDGQSREAPTTTKSLIRAAGLRSLGDLISRRDQEAPLELGTINDDGRFDPFRARLNHIVRDLFVGESVHLEIHKGHEHLVRKPSQYFDVRQVGRCSHEPTGDAVRIFCCRYGEGIELPHIVLLQNLEELLENPELPANLHLAIPSRAGLTPPDAISLVHPLRMHPREYIESGDVGAIFACTEGAPGYTCDLYWSREAFIESLNHVQDIGRDLIRKNALARATMRGRGEAEIERASSILSKVYEGAAHHCHTLEQPLLTTGIWGVGVFPVSSDAVECQLGFVGFRLKEGADQRPAEIVSGEPPVFAVLNQRIERDDFGFITLTAGKFSTFPVADLPWYEVLPKIGA